MTNDLDAINLDRFRRMEKCETALVCDTCGKCWPDDSASDMESCLCGRFKQRMEWATVQDVAKDAANHADHLAARVKELEAKLGRVRQSIAQLDQDYKDRKHGGVAQSQCIDRIRQALGTE